ncbi:MAG: hypothetical protein RIC29_02595 [Rhodospirillaceae bacterium]
MRLHWCVAVCVGFGLSACSEDYAGFCEDVAMQFKTDAYDKFEITDIIDYTTQDNPKPEVYVRFTAMRESGFEENRNVTCAFDMDAKKLAATDIHVDGRKLAKDMVSQYNASLTN